MENTWPEEALGEAVKLISFANDGNDGETQIIDIGAHRGETINSIDNNIFKPFRYIGLEPNPDAYRDFKVVSDQISLKGNKIVCLQEAAGNEIGTAEFLMTKASAVGGILPPVDGLSERVPSGDHIIEEVIKVKVNTVDNLMKEFEISELALLKVDTEGFDLEVLKGAKNALQNHQIQVVVTEAFYVPYRKNQAYFWDLATFMEGLGYHFVNIYDSRNTSQGRLYTSNAIWVSYQIAEKLNYL